MSLVLKNGKVFQNGALVETNVLIKDDKIVEIGSGVVGDEEMDCSGKLILPGMIDAHVHFRGLKMKHKEDFLTGSRAAAAGGVTTILSMPNTKPSLTDEKTFATVKKAAQKSIVNYGVYIGATNENASTVGRMDGAVAVKAYVGSTTGDLLFDDFGSFVRLLENTEKLVVVHAEDQSVLKHYKEKHRETEKHHLMRDNLAALTATARVVLAANYLSKRVHIAHMSTKEEVDFLKLHKTEFVTCEVAPHHLFYTHEYFDEKGNYGKMNPPLRYEKDRKALWGAIREGMVDIIATDHAPHTKEEKEKEFHDAPCGVPGVQTMLPLMLNSVHEGKLELKDVVRLCSENPAKIFGLDGRGFLKEGNYADIVVVDMDREETITNEQQFTKCGWTPFHGMKVKGWPVVTIVNGNVVFNNGKVVEDKKGVDVEN